MTTQAGSKGAALAELARLYFEHKDTLIHTGGNYVDGCPTCDPEIPFTKSLDRLITIIEIETMKEVG